MLEGKEVDIKIGEIGHASVDLDDKLNLEIAVGVKVDLFKEIVKLTKKTKTPIDDGAAAFLGKLFGRSADEVLAVAAQVAAADAPPPGN